MDDIEKNTIHVALGVGDFTDLNYCKHAAVTMLSIIKNTKSNVIFHLVGGTSDILNISNEVRTLFSRFENCKYYTIDVSKYLPDLYSFKVFTKFSSLKLFLPKILIDIPKVIYVDCDIVFNEVDIEELWNMNVEKIGAVREPISLKNCDKYALKQIIDLHIDTTNYHNSGVLVMNLDNLRDIDKEIENNLDSLKNCLYFDQDFINYMYKIQTLDEKYNWITTHHDSDEGFENKIIHYVSNSKPWLAYRGRISEVYWKYRLEIENLDDSISLMLKLPNMTKEGLANMTKSLKGVKELQYVMECVLKYKGKRYIQWRLGLK